MGHTAHSAHPRPAADQESSVPHRWLALALLGLAQFMLILDHTVVNVALPSMGADLGLERAALTWVVAAYALVFGGLMLLGGRLADAFGARRTLLAGLAIFTSGSLLAGIAVNGAILIAGRVTQGLGAALVAPSALAIIAVMFHGQDRNRAFGVWAAIGSGGAAVGVLVSGLVTSGPGWRWVFFINIPVGLIALAALPTVLAAVRPGAGDRRADVPGAVTVTAGTVLLVYGLVEAGDTGWLSAWTLVPIGLSLIAYLAFVAIERNVEAPLVRLGILTQRPVVAGMFLMLIATSLMAALFFLCSLYVQQILQLSALRTGLLFLPAAIAVATGAQLAGHLIGRIGGRPIAFAGFTLLAIGTGLLTQLSGQPNVYVTLLPGLLIAALGIAPLFVTAISTTMSKVAPQEAGLASGVVNTFHEMGGAIGVAVLSTVAAGSIGVGHSAITGGFSDAFTVAAVAAAASAVIAPVLLPPGRTAGVAGHGLRRDQPK